MALTQHFAIIVTTQSQFIKILKKGIKLIVKDTEIKMPISRISYSEMNGHCHFTVFPDGDKYDENEPVREKIRDYLNKSDSCTWVEVSYGEAGYEIVE